jgi:hypothetical protein
VLRDGPLLISGVLRQDLNLRYMVAPVVALIGVQAIVAALSGRGDHRLRR